MKRDAVRQTGVALAVGAGVVLGVTGDYGSGTDSPSLVQPPDWAFGIWGPIYAGLLGYAVHQALPSQRESEAQRRVGWWAAAAVGSSGFWVRVFPLEVLLATEALVLFTLVTAGVAFWRARPGAVALARRAPWLVRAPLGLFFGWITVATVVGSTQAVLAEPWGAVAAGVPWAVGGLALVAAGASAVTLAARSSLTYPAAVAWGLIGVLVAQGAAQPVVGAAALAGALAVAGAGTAVVARRRGRPVVPATG